MDYFASPQRASPYLPPLIIGVDFNKCEANMVGTGDEPFYKWTEQMGMVGSRTTWNQLIKLGEKIRGKNFGVKRVTIDETLKQCDLISTDRMT
ncbi:unnamed protein product [Rotaria socialis]|uniref:Uncharacterized protein n=1 Tax=Rotaria socialis TaxID=392032 RepID=A0A818EL62_9BILA|nr:unnamed protein product [Rotaria socialis]CAF3460800.1 unnamed protein product [Rotaria socialis]CAF4438692.1 unnamed protein product [Rotaria socialis]CAF4463508.1 unnamed protein product [Rotaria socialis]CAF4546588.1 unnamed protein product [Rotaria socialis]